MATRYTDSDRAAVLAALQANGGNVAKTARETGVPRVTLIGWAKDSDRQGRTADVVTRKRVDLADVIRAELDGIFAAMATKRGEASYRELATAAGILTDKLVRLSEVAPNAVLSSLTVGVFELGTVDGPPIIDVDPRE